MEMTQTANKNIFDAVVSQALCVGCGACLYSTPAGEARMAWNPEGFLVPQPQQPGAAGEESLKVCPFNPCPEEAVRTENELAELFLTEAPRRHPRVGPYFDTYAGYSVQYRPASSSGGLATYLMDRLLKSKTVDAVIAVKEGKEGREGKEAFYEYAVLQSSDELTGASKTRYYPVTLGGLMEQLRSGNRRYAVVGVACFIKAVRLLQQYHPELREKIRFTIGIICGGLKSRFFAEYLAGRSGVNSRQFSAPQFRIKDSQSTASDYAYGCKDQKGQWHSIRMKTVGDMWGSGLFKNNACDFCDDVTAELADISLGDAWLSPYKNDGRGTNVIVTRSRAAEEFIHQGMESRDLIVEPLAFDRFLHSQQGSFYHRQRALGYRMKQAGKQGWQLPPKRHDNEKTGLVAEQVQKQRSLLRQLSLTVWAATGDSALFDRALRKPLHKLKVLTKINRCLRSIQKGVGL